MFLCIGENADDDQAIGKGDSAIKAVENWASFASDAIQEFNDYRPTLYMAHEVKATIKPAKIFLK